MPVIVHQANERKRLGLEYRKSIKEMPYLSLSFGLYWMATVLFLYSPFWLDSTMQSSFARPQAGIITACASIATYFCCASCFRSFAKLDEKPHFLSALSATMALGTVLYLISLAGFLSADFSMFLYIAGLVLLGASTAIACLEFARIFAHIGPQRVLFHGTISLFAGSIGAFVVSLLPEVACAFALIALPAPMSLCLRKTLGALSLPQRKKIFTRGIDQKVHIPRRFLVTSAIQGLALGVMHHLLSEESFAAFSTAGFCIAAILLAITAIVVMQDFNTLFYRVGFPMMALGFFAVSNMPDNLAIGCVILDAGYCYQYLISCCLCAYLAQHFEQSPIWIVGISTGSLLLGQFIGGFFAFAPSDSTATASLVAFLILGSALYLFSNQNITSGWGPIRPGENVFIDPLQEACRSFADAHGLSTREKEVMTLLVKGRTRKEISEELHLSEETIKSHTSNVYQKTSVHSKRELARLVEESMQVPVELDAVRQASCPLGTTTRTTR